MGFARIWHCIAILTKPVRNVNHGDGNEGVYVGGQDGLQDLCEMCVCHIFTSSDSTELKTTSLPDGAVQLSSWTDFLCF